MMKFNQDQNNRRIDLIRTLFSRRDELSSAIQAFNQGVEQARLRVGSLAETYNEVIRDTESFRVEIQSAQEAYLNDMTNERRESIEGEEYAAWAAEWGQGFNEITVDFPGSVELPDRDAEFALCNLDPMP